MTELFTRHGSKHEGKVQYDDKKNPFYTYWENCSRCGGAGGSDRWAYTGWTCFQCSGGRGSDALARLYTQEQLDKLNATAKKREDRKRAKVLAAQAIKNAEIVARQAEFEAANKTFFDDVVAFCINDEFVMNVVATVTRNASMSERQRELLERNLSEAKRKATTQHVGQIGDKLEFEGEIITAYYMPSTNYGWAGRTIYVVRTQSGSIKYTGSADLGRKGEIVKFKATVKGHEEYKGEKQTVVERPKVIETKQIETVEESPLDLSHAA